MLFLNIGSVGKPKDGDWRACYALLEPGTAQPVRFVRLQYHIGSVTAALRHSELPHEFAADLDGAGVPVNVNTK